jgi:hypothetical protein
MTRISERFGSKLGGLLIALPSITLVGLSFIALTQNPEVLVAATTVMPSSIAASTIFLMSFVFLYRFGWIRAYLGAVAVWFALNLPLVVFKVENIGLSVLLAALFFCVSIAFFRKYPHRKLLPSKISGKAFLFRVFFAGGFIALAVLLAELLGPAWGGLFASFPAAFSAAVLLFARKHGIDFTTSVSRTMVTGALANVGFVVGIFLLVPHIGSTLGIMAAYFMCLVLTLFSYRYLSLI